ncbi:MAG: hypothetical protein HY902_02995 [Deltaproteobacteria bacterium]|nr:hypothetical protein [Deltaproteobacteria bacterium]
MRRPGWYSFVLGTAVVAYSAPALAAKGGAVHPVAKLVAQAEAAQVRDITVLAVAEPLGREHAAGSAALVRIDDGRDGGLPNCFLLELAGKPAGPVKIDAKLRLSVCPAGPAKGVQLSRQAISNHQEAWLVRLEHQRYDSKGHGAESSILWGLYGRPLGESEPRAVWERTSTTFKSRDDPGNNVAEVCTAPDIAAGGQEPTTIAIQCDTEVMLGKLPKRAKQTFTSVWSADRYVAKD